MRKTIFYSVLVAMALVMTLSGCRKSGLQNIRGEVKNISFHNDTLKAMTIFINEDKDTMVFSLAEARLQRGVMMFRDSVIVDYVEGRDDTMRALVVTVLPREIKLVEDAITDTIATATIEHHKDTANVKKAK